MAIGCDIADSASVEALVDTVAERFGALHVLINNAYLGNLPGPLETKAAGDFARALQVSFYAPLGRDAARLPAHEGAALGPRHQHVLAQWRQSAYMYTADYNVSKEACAVSPAAQRANRAAHGITVNAICPVARTPAYERFAAASPENAAQLLRQNPMGRMGEPEEDIGSVIASSSAAMPAAT